VVFPAAVGGADVGAAVGGVGAGVGVGVGTKFASTNFPKQSFTTELILLHIGCLRYFVLNW
jgi:hypothetical protein